MTLINSIILIAFASVFMGGLIYIYRVALKASHEAEAYRVEKKARKKEKKRLKKLALANSGPQSQS